MALTLRDKQILDLASRGLGADAIEAKTGFPAAKVALEIDRLLSQNEFLDDLQKLRLMLATDYYPLKDHLRTQAIDGQDEKAATQLIKLLSDMANLIDRISERVDKSVEKIEDRHAREMMRIVENSFYATLASLKKRLPELDESEVEEEFRFNLQMVAADFDSKETK